MTLRFVLASAVILLLAGCITEAPINGTFSGSVDAQPAKAIRILFHTTGDGLTTGSWKSTTLITNGLVTAEQGFFGGRSFKLNVDDGPCKGVFDIHLTTDESKVVGDVDPSAVCAEKKMSFTLPLVEKKAALKQPST